MKMKKIYALILGLGILAAFASSCSKSEFETKFYDPSKTTTVTCDKLMTGAFYVAIDQYVSYGYASYWRLYTWENYFARLAQTVGFTNDSGTVYFLQDGWANNRWENFYEMLMQYRRLQETYNNEDAESQAEDKIFLDLTEVYLYDQLSQVVDMFGPVPFEKAGYLGITGDLASSYASYDSDKDLYKMMIDRLGELYTEIGSIKSSITSVVQAKLTKQDFINGGDLDKWLRFTNSLRLRLAMRVATNGDLTSTGQAAVKDAAGKSLITTIENATVGKVGPESTGGMKFWEGYREGYGGDGLNSTASQAMIDAMMITGDEDPRLRVIYNPNEAGQFIGKSVKETKAAQEANDNLRSNNWTNRVYATLDSVTFIGNGLMENFVFSPAETYFILAEAYQRGYASGDAKAAFKNGVKYSVYQYYYWNMNSTPQGNMSTYRHYKADAVPSDASIEAYAEKVWNAYSDKVEAIMTQKWLHFGLTDAHQAWSDIRRTGYPALDHPTDAQAQVNPNVTQRVCYPLKEKNNNTANYNAAITSVGNDSATHVLFWAKEVK